MRIRMLAVVCVAACIAYGVAPAFGASGSLRVFLDCSVCDHEFLKQEITYVDWVRERRDADVYVLVTTRGTGVGGTETQLFVARPRGGGPADSLSFVTLPSATSDESRQTMKRALQAAIARDLVGRPEFGRLDVTVRPAPPPGALPSISPIGPNYDPTRPTPLQPHDPWNAWVFSISANGFLQGQQFTRSSSLTGDVSASRITEDLKVVFFGYGTYYEDSYTFDDGSEFTSIRRGRGGNARTVFTLSPRWGAGVRTFYSSSSFSNLSLEVGGGPALEFNIWPYAESSRRLLTISYEATGRWVEYDEITLFDRTEERLWRHALTVRLSSTQPWGSTSFTGDASQYLRMSEKYRLTASTNLSLNLARGFSLNLSGYAAHLRDLLSLRRSGATDEEVLARQRQIATSYEFIASVGVSYTFGSIYQKVVNPRLGAVYGRF